MGVAGGGMGIAGNVGVVRGGVVVAGGDVGVHVAGEV